MKKSSGEKKMKSNVKLITVGAVTLALTAVLGLLPYVFLIPLLFTCVTRGWRMTFFESLCFGVLSLLYAFMSPASFVAAAFIANPWIPIIPRIVAGLGCHATYVGLRRVCKGESKFMRALPVVAACAVGSILNTVTVVPCLMWRGGMLFGTYEMTRAILLTETLISGAIELAVAVSVVPSLAFAVGKALRLDGYESKRKLEKAATNAENCAVDNREKSDICESKETSCAASENARRI